MIFNNHMAYAVWFFCIFAFANHVMCPGKHVLLADFRTTFIINNLIY